MSDAIANSAPLPRPVVLTAVAYAGSRSAPRYTIGTLVTSPEQYGAMRESFTARGFDSDTCEFLYLDNRGPNQTGAYRGLNALLHAARGDYVILCHPDVRLLSHDIVTLDLRLAGRHQPGQALCRSADLSPGPQRDCLDPDPRPPAVDYGRPPVLPGK